MRQEVSLGPAPAEETCAQVGEEDYDARARRECDRYIRLIREKMGPEPDGARLTRKSNEHDFGPYMDVVCRYDDSDERATAYAFACEANSPATWDDTARVDWESELRQGGERAAA